MSSNSVFLQSYFDEVWSNGKVSAISNYFSPRVMWNGVLPEDIVGIDEIAELVHMLRDLAHDIDIKIERALDDDPWLSALICLRGQTTLTAEPLCVQGQVMLRFEKGLIAEVYNSMDNITLYEQLGQLPKNSVALLMGGARLQ